MIQTKEYFFIVSFPRCRSTWFSIFLSTNVSHCFHEVLSSFRKDAFKKIKDFPRPFVGSADTNPVSLLNTPVPVKNPVTGQAFPVVVIERNTEDVFKSMMNAFDTPEQFSKEEWEICLFHMIDSYQACLETIREEGENVLSVKFEELEENEALKKIWSHCIPDYEPDASYIDKFQKLRITGKSKVCMTTSMEKSAKNRGMTVRQMIDNTINHYDATKFRDLFNKKAEGPRLPLAPNQQF